MKALEIRIDDESIMKMNDLSSEKLEALSAQVSSHCTEVLSNANERIFECRSSKNRNLKKAPQNFKFSHFLSSY